MVFQVGNTLYNSFTSLRRSFELRRLLLSSAGFVLHNTLRLLSLPPDYIFTHILSKGTNVHSPSEKAAMEEMIAKEGIERVVILDQGSRGGEVVGNLEDGGSGVMIVDHHMSDDVRVSPRFCSSCELISYSVIVPTIIPRPYRLPFPTDRNYLSTNLPHLSSPPPLRPPNHFLGRPRRCHRRSRNHHQMGYSTLAIRIPHRLQNSRC